MPTVYRGRIDTLVIQDQFWVLAIEQKETAVAIAAALPQLFAYMLSYSTSQDTVFGMVSNSNEFVFAKLVKGTIPQYSYSDVFWLYSRQNKLYGVLRVLKRIANLLV